MNDRTKLGFRADRRRPFSWSLSSSSVVVAVAVSRSRLRLWSPSVVVVVPSRRFQTAGYSVVSFTTKCSTERNVDKRLSTTLSTVKRMLNNY